MIKDLELPESDSKGLSIPEVILTPEVKPTAQPEDSSPDLNEQTSASRYPKRLRRPPEWYHRPDKHLTKRGEECSIS